MLKTVVKLVRNLSEENQQLRQENLTLKQKLQFRHTQINDLRYAKRELEKRVKIF